VPFQNPHLLVGVSARIYYPAQPVLDLGGVWTRTLHYLEQSVAHWLMRGGALPVMVPAVDATSAMKREDLNLGHYVQALDALVLQGGNDVAPQSYGETPIRPEWAGDPTRDRYEMELVEAFVRAKKPVFGICRGLQLLNVTFGGSLWQDLQTQNPGTVLKHVDISHYERNTHDIEIVPDTRLAQLYPGCMSRQVNSIHHQGIKRLASDFVAEARSPADGVIEAVRHRGDCFVMGVQWHPEFHPPGHAALFDDGPLLKDFLTAVRQRKAQ
jgi:putative glutamine amidotransferase